MTKPITSREAIELLRDLLQNMLKQCGEDLFIDCFLFPCPDEKGAYLSGEYVISEALKATENISDWLPVGEVKSQLKVGQYYLVKDKDEYIEYVEYEGDGKWGMPHWVNWPFCTFKYTHVYAPLLPEVSDNG